MIRETVGALMAVTMSVILLWFILPMLNVTYEQVKATVDLSHPTTETLVTLGDGMYLILGFIAVLVPGYLIFAYASRIVPFDTSY
jgi:type II secretory pathway component PulF